MPKVMAKLPNAPNILNCASALACSNRKPCCSVYWVVKSRRKGKNITYVEKRWKNIFFLFSLDLLIFIHIIIVVWIENVKIKNILLQTKIVLFIVLFFFFQILHFPQSGCWMISPRFCKTLSEMEHLNSCILLRFLKVLLICFPKFLARCLHWVKVCNFFLQIFLWN